MENYLEQTVIGRGQFGTVSLATRVSDLKAVVIKKIPLDSSDARERDSALNEARLLKVLDHPNIIQYYESFIGERDTLMIVMEYARGGTLASFLAQQVGQFIDEDVILQLFSQMVLAIAYIHARNILHRDLKPQNILLDETMRIIKLGDFGISTVLSTKTKATTVVGTPNYLGPEVCEGRPYNNKSDIWSLGCVLFEMMALHRAFDGSNLGAIVNLIQKAKLKQPLPSHYPEYLKKLTTWMLEKIPHYRPTAAQVLSYPPVMLATAKVVCSVGKILALPTKPGTSSHQKHGGPVSLRRNSTSNPREDGQSPQQQCFLMTSDSVCSLPLSYQSQTLAKISAGRDVIAGVIAGSGKPFLWEEIDRLAEKPEFTLKSLHLDVNLVVTEVACGENFVVALSERGLVLTTGNGCYGCLGHGIFSDILGSWRIVDALLGSRTIAIGCGSRHVLAAGEEGQLHGWGESQSGRLGKFCQSLDNADGSTMVTVPRQIDLTKLPQGFIPTKIFCGNDCSCLLLSKIDSPVLSLGVSGSNRNNRLLQGSTVNVISELTEAKLPNDIQPVKLSFGIKHALVQDSSGQVWGWGDNGHHQIQPSGTKNQPEMVPLLEDGEKSIDIGCGDFFSVILLQDGKVKMAGKALCGMFGQWMTNRGDLTKSNASITAIMASDAKLLLVETLNISKT